MHRAQQGVNQCFQMLRANRREPDDPHASVFGDSRREISSAIHRNVVAHLCKARPDFLVIGFNSAVLGNNPPAADEGDAQSAFCVLVLSVQLNHLYVMFVGRVIPAEPIPVRSAHCSAVSGCSLEK